ncbi:MAG: hypothetical protein DWQ02_12255 [Bacteroidetes bacterium]|nr:MAG: hypothetical protein DWQ02_12255 [Bacteroidota bacterium]
MDDKKKNEDTNDESGENKDKLELKVNELGEITSNLDMDKINKFLDENVEDKKLQGSDDEE